MRANITISIDATSPELNDATVDVSESILDLFLKGFGGFELIEHSAERIVATIYLHGNFQEIEE